MTIDATENPEIEMLLQEVKRTILGNRIFLESLKQEPLADEPEASEVELPADGASDETFEEL